MSQPWSDQKKVEAVTTYLALGKLPMVEQVTGIPRTTLRQWKLQPWWKELIEEIQNEEDLELDSKLRKVVDRSLDAVMERIDGGEFIIDSKTGTVKRVPVKLRDVHRVMADTIDKRNLIRERPVQRQLEKQSVDLLSKLAGQFAEWAKNMSPRIIEGEIVAVYDERASGLQEGVQPLPLETQTEEKQS